MTPLQFGPVQRTACELALIQLREVGLRWCLENLVNIAVQLIVQAFLRGLKTMSLRLQSCPMGPEMTGDNTYKI